MKKYTFLFTVILILLFNTSTHTQWFQQNSGTTHNLFNVYFVNQNMGWVTVNYENSGTSYNSILATNNGGLNWFNQYSYSIGKTDYITSIFFLNETSGFYTEVTYYPEWIQSQIFSTMNGGFGWSNIFNDIGLNLNSIFFINQNTGWAVGSDGQKYTNTTGKILKSTDGGISWSFLPDLPNNYLEEVFFINQSTGWIASLGGIYKTTNGGYNWFINYNNNNFAVSDVKFKDQNIGWAVGYEGVCNSGSIIRSTNGGVNWVEQCINNTVDLNSISFADQYNVWTVGDGGKILNTTNGGINWNFQVAGVYANNSIFFIDQNTGWVVGISGTIYKTTNGGNPIGIKPICNETPLNYKLLQNYPNPFNPSTTIEFDLQKSKYTRLIIYDLTGKEIETLVSEYLKAGSYKVNFDGGNLSSGIYFYKLETNEYTLSRKMVLMK